MVLREYEKSDTYECGGRRHCECGCECRIVGGRIEDIIFGITVKSDDGVDSDRGAIIGPVGHGSVER